MPVATKEARAERVVSHERASKAAQRLVNSHFNNNRETHPHARMTIPVELDDDDVVIFDYIAQRQAATEGQEELILLLNDCRAVAIVFGPESLVNRIEAVLAKYGKS